MFWLLLGLVSAILLLMMYTRKKDSNLPPGPKGLPFVGKFIKMSILYLYSVRHFINAPFLWENITALDSQSLEITLLCLRGRKEVLSSASSAELPNIYDSARVSILSARADVPFEDKVSKWIEILFAGTETPVLPTHQPWLISEYMIRSFQISPQLQNDCTQ